MLPSFAWKERLKAPPLRGICQWCSLVLRAKPHGRGGWWWASRVTERPFACPSEFSSQHSCHLGLPGCSGPTQSTTLPLILVGVANTRSPFESQHEQLVNKIFLGPQRELTMSVTCPPVSPSGPSLSKPVVSQVTSSRYKSPITMPFLHDVYVCHVSATPTQCARYGKWKPAHSLQHHRLVVFHHDKDPSWGFLGGQTQI